MGADLDVAELHLTVKNYLTRQPYVDRSGLTSLDMPYDSIEVADVMFEAKIGDISTAKVTLPSLIAFPALRPLLQQLKEGDRVELYNFQPDCGDPVIAGFITPEGIEEADGKVTLIVEDTLGQLKWQRLKRYEYLSGPVSTLYQRAMSVWADLVNEDFLGTNPAGDYTITVTLGTPTVVFGAGFVQIPAGSVASPEAIVSPSRLANAIQPRPGDVYLLEADVVITTDFGVSDGAVGLELDLVNLAVPSFRIGAQLFYQPSGVGTFPVQQATGLVISPTGGGTAHVVSNAANLVSCAMPQTHRLAVYLRFNADGTVSGYAYLDSVNVEFLTYPWNFDSTGYTPGLLLTGGLDAGDLIKVAGWRVAKLVAALLPAARFKPQTSDAITYQPNFESNLDFLQLIAEKDGAEFRPLYHAWPQIDELEVDQAGTLGKYASRTLGYEQPASLPSEGLPQISPLPVIMDQGSFLTAPPFRLEEGYNFASAPRTRARASAHANDIIRVGASTQEAQVFGEKWSSTEVGRPQHSPSGAQYPRFEQITNDDRVGIQSLASSLAGLELARRTDGIPSLEVDIADEVFWAFRWRVGDLVYVGTRSLRTNLEQEMRVAKLQYRAGSPVRSAILGKIDSDPTMLRLLADDTKISWLYDQSGSSPTIYAYPSLGNILSGAKSAIFTIPLDQYTTGSSLVYAALHWFTDASVMKINPMLNGSSVSLAGLPGASGTDSGLIICTAAFQGPGTYQLQFQNNDSATRNLTGAFLVLRIKA